MDEVVTLRVACEEDADAIRALTREAYAKWVDLTGREPLPMRVDYSDALRKHCFDLLYVGSRLVALIETVPEGDYLLIENVAVCPIYQGRGFGTRLLRLAEDLAASVTVNYEVLDSVVDPLRNMRRASMRSCWHAKNSNVAGSRSLIPLSPAQHAGAL